MSDEKPVPETLASIAQQIRELTRLTKSFVERFDGNDKRFAGMDARFDAVDRRFDELKAQLRTEIESVRADVRPVAEGSRQERRATNSTSSSTRVSARLDKHEARTAVLEDKAKKKREEKDL